MGARYQWRAVVFALCLALLSAAPTSAQITLPGAENALSITFSPLSPAPNDTVLLSIQSSLIDISRGDVLWQASGKTIAQGRGVDTASTVAGALGAETRITVSVVTPDGLRVSAQATIIPTELDLLVDSDSYIPPFYRGWPRPSAGTNLHLQALPRFKRAGVFLSASELIYTWKRNGEVLGTLSGRGKSTATIPMLHLFGTDTISVEARSSDDLLSHASSVSLSAVEPVLNLYQDHPLYGVLYHRALPASAFIPETEMTFSAIPFFIQAQSMYDRGLLFDWRVNTATIPTNAQNPNELTINAENSSGVAFVELDVTHATNYYLNAKGAWNITFSSSGGASDPFQNVTQ